MTSPTPFTELHARRLGPVRRWFIRHPVAMDVVVMAWFAVPGVVGVLLGLDETASRGGALAFVGLGTAALAFRRRAPVVTVAVVGVLGVASLAVIRSSLGFDLAAALALYAVAVCRPPRTTWLTAAALTLGLVAGVWVWEQPYDTSFAVGANPPPTAPGESTDLRVGSMTSVVVLMLAAIAIGTGVRNRRLHVAELVDRANALARDRDQQAELARASERARIAREMHDVVAHSLSVMIALADGAGAAIDRSPDRARTALGELSATGRSALTDMRRVLGVLADDAPLEPQPAGHDLAGVVERFRTAGVRVRTRGLSTELPPDTALQLAVFRIVTEALTNALRHAPGAQVDVTLRRAPDGVEITVVDDGGTRPPGDLVGAGRGLIGMGERAAVHGGTVDAGPHDGGWRVRAVLPWRETEGTA